MAFSGGVFNRLYNWAVQRDAGTKIRADQMDLEMDGMATGLSTCLLKDGTQTVTADIKLDTYKLLNVGDAVARNQYLAAGQLQDGEVNWVDGGGTADDITATYVPNLTALVDGMLLGVRATAANTGATTFDPGPGSALAVVKGADTALVAGDIIGDGHELLLRYRHSDTKWVLLNPGVANGNFLAGITAGTAAASKALVLDASADLTSGINDFTVDNDVYVGNDVSVASSLVHTGDTDNKITFGTDTQTFTTGNVNRVSITDAGFRLAAGGARVTTINDTDNMSDASATTLATSESIKAYVDNTVAAETLSSVYTSTDQTCTLGGTLALTHGLGGIPLLIQALLVCQTTNNGYTAGDLVVVNNNTNAVNADAGISFVLTSTQIKIGYSPTTIAQLVSSDGSATFNAVAAQWKLRVRAWI